MSSPGPEWLLRAPPGRRGPGWPGGPFRTLGFRVLGTHGRGAAFGHHGWQAFSLKGLARSPLSKLRCNH